MKKRCDPGPTGMDWESAPEPLNAPVVLVVQVERGAATLVEVRIE